MRKVSIIVLAALLMFAVVGCGGKTASEDNKNTQEPQQQQKEESKEQSKGQPKVLSLGTHAVGSLVNTVGTGLATEISKTMGVEVKTVPLTGPQEWLPMINSGEMDMGVMNHWDSEQGWLGGSTYGAISNNKGFPISLIATGGTTLVGILVAEDSGIRTGADLKGKRYAGIITGSPGITAQADSFLANYGLTRDDVKELSVPSIAAAATAVIEGKADATGVALGMANVQELEAAKGARFLSFGTSPEAIARMNEKYPGKMIQVSPSPQNVGIREPNTNMWSYNMYLVGRTELSEETVYNIVKNLWENNAELTAINKNMKSWTTDQFAVDNFTIPYHPGAVKFFKEKGVWSDAKEKHQQELLAKKK